MGSEILTRPALLLVDEPQPQIGQAGYIKGTIFPILFSPHLFCGFDYLVNLLKKSTMAPKRTTSKTATTTAATSEDRPDTGLESGNGVGDDSGIDLSLDIIGIEELQNHGVNVADIQKLRAAGIHSVSVLTRKHKMHSLLENKSSNFFK